MTLSDDELRALGRVAASFATMEMMVSFLVWTLISSDQAVGQLITSGESFDTLLRRLRDVAGHRLSGSPSLAAIESFLQKAYRARGRRNDVLHSAWADSVDEYPPPEGAGRTAIRFTRKGMKSAQFTAEEVNGIADEIREAIADLWKILGGLSEPSS